MSDLRPETLNTVNLRGLLDKFLDDDSKLSPVTGKPLNHRGSLRGESGAPLDPNKIAQYTPSVN